MMVINAVVVLPLINLLCNYLTLNKSRHTIVVDYIHSRSIIIQYTFSFVYVIDHNIISINIKLKLTRRQWVRL